MRRLRGASSAASGSLWAAILALGCAGGCASGPRLSSWQTVPPSARDAAAFATARRTVREAFPPVYRATQRAIITVRKHQFVCDGLLSVSPADAWHLALISTLGLVTDLRVKGDGSSEVLKVTPLFREQWAREYVAEELRWLFNPPPALAPAGCLSDGRLLLEAENRLEGVTARYVCSADGSRWEELEVSKGTRRLFHARIAGRRLFPGWPRAIPAEMDVVSATHQLQMRILALSLATVSSPEAQR